MTNEAFYFEGMVNKLSMEDRGDDVSFVSLVAKSMFEDGNSNWGRVASLVAFGAVVAQYMKESGRRDCVEQVAQEISTYLLTDQRDWLIKNNAWVSSRDGKWGRRMRRLHNCSIVQAGCVVWLRLSPTFSWFVCRTDLWSFSKRPTRSRGSGTC